MLMYILNDMFLWGLGESGKLMVSKIFLWFNGVWKWMWWFVKGLVVFGVVCVLLVFGV